MTARRLSRPALETHPGSGSGRHHLLGRDELEHRQKGDPGAAEEDERDQVAGRMEAIGPARDGSDLPVRPLGAPIVEAKRDVREDAFEVILDRASELLEGFEARPVGPANPLAKLDARDVDIQTIDVARVKLREWIGWADRSRLEPFKKLARTVKDHFEGILAYIPLRLNNGRTEGTNGKIRTITRRSYGFHSASNLIALIFLCCSGISLLPVLKFVPTKRR